MSTRSYICKELENGKYKTIYCHSDGYLTYNGAMLIDYYNDRMKVEELLALGDISSLSPEIYPDPRYPHSFDYNQRQENVVIAYGRDRGDTGVEAKEFSFEELTNENTWIEYIYIFNKDNFWQVGEYPFKQSFKPLQQELDKVYERMGIKRPPNCYGYLSEEGMRKIKKKQSEETM